jgi:TonB family protein
MLKRILLLFFHTLPIFIFAQKTDNAYINAPVISPPKEIKTITTGGDWVEPTMPYLKLEQCDSLPYSQKKFCSDQYLKAFIEDYMIYPMPDSGYEGRVYISFIVTENGNMQKIEVIKNMSPHQALADEALRLVQLLSEHHRWYSAQQKGKAVKVRMVIPVIFKLK